MRNDVLREILNFENELMSKYGLLNYSALLFVTSIQFLFWTFALGFWMNKVVAFTLFIIFSSGMVIGFIKIIKKHKILIEKRDKLRKMLEVRGRRR
jgi:hypothetical protein